MPHDKMILSVTEAENLTLIPKKTTAILATCQSDMKVFMWSIFSLLLRSKPENLEHIMVCINGGDERHGCTSLQDNKQKFLEEMRRLKWQKRDMPLTIIRAWSRVGHGQALEMAIPWVHTEYYTIMHDDVILKNDWDVESFEQLKKENSILAYFPPLLWCGVGKAFDKEWRITLPHMNTTLVTCKKALITALGVRWYGYHVNHKFNLYEKVDIKKFLEYHQKNSNIQSFPVIEEPYGVISMDIGSWVYCKAKEYSMHRIGTNKAIHFESMSWGQDKDDRIKKNIYDISLLEQEIEEVPEYKSIYEKYLE